MSAVLTRAYGWSASTVQVLQSTGVQTTALQSAASIRFTADGIGQTPPTLSWLELTDSRGISMWNYELSIDRGGGFLTPLDPGKFIWAATTDLWWGTYRISVAVALWFLQWVLSFGWVQLISAPLQQVGIAMQQVVDRIGVQITFLTITTLIASMWVLRGRYATAVWEVAVALIIAALATGIFAQPVLLVGGPDGYIVKANEAGQSIAASLYTGQSEDVGSQTGSQKAGNAQIGLLVDTFIRQPAEVVNFGQPIDGTDCEAAYTDVVKDGPYGDEDDIRQAMGECDDDLKDYADHPSQAMALGAVAFFPAASAIMLLALVLAGSMLVTSVWALYQSLKAIVMLVWGLLPGGARGSLMLTIAEVIMALVAVVFVNVFLGVFLMVIQNMFAQSDGSPKTFVIADILIFVGIIVWWRQRKLMKMSARRMAEWMAQRPGASATRMPARAGITLGGVASGVRTAASIAQMRRYHPAPAAPAMGPVYIDNRRQAAFLAGFGMWGGAPAPANPGGAIPVGTPPGLPAGPSSTPPTSQPPGPSGPPSSPQPPGAPPGTPGTPSGPGPTRGGGQPGAGFVARIAGARGTRALLRTGANLAMATATGGTAPVIAAAAGRAAGAARLAGKTARAATTGQRLMTARRANVVSQINTARRTARVAARTTAPARARGTRATGGSRTAQPTSQARMRPAPYPSSQQNTAGYPPGSSTPRAPQVIRGEVIDSSRATDRTPRAAGRRSSGSGDGTVRGNGPGSPAPGKTQHAPANPAQGRAAPARSTGQPAQPRATGRSGRPRGPSAASSSGQNQNLTEPGDSSPSRRPSRDTRRPRGA